MQINQGDAVAFRPSGSPARVVALVLAVALQPPPREGAEAPPPLLDLVYVVPSQGDPRRGEQPGMVREARGVARATQLATTGWEHLGLLGQGAELEQPAEEGASAGAGDDEE